MMKKLFFLSAILFFAITAFSQSRASYTSTGGGGNWGASTTWSPSGVPVDGDDVTISSGNPVTVASPNSRAASTITVNTGATLTVSSGATLTTSGNVTVNGTLAQNGTLTVGDAVTDNLTIDGGTIDLGNGSTTNVAGYYAQINSATLSSTSGYTATINFSTAGDRSDATNNVYFQGGGTYTPNGAIIDFNLANGNSGSAAEVYIGNPFNGNGDNGTFTFGNGSGTTVTDWELQMEYGTGLNNPIIDIGSGNTFRLTQTTELANAYIYFSKFTITSGTFEIGPAANMAVGLYDQLTIGADGSLVIISDATGTGELKFGGSSSVAATVNRYIVGQQWHQISPTTDNLQTSDIFQNYSPNVWLMEYDVANQKWVYMDTVAPLDTTLQVGHGYIVYGQTLSRADDFTFSYTGNLRSTDLAITGIGSNPNDLQLIGNPFSSSLDIDNGLQNANNLYGEIWVWDPVNDNYATYTTGGGGNHSGKVAAGQGFFVETNAVGGGGSITLSASDRTFTSGNTFYKEGGLLDWDNNYGKGLYVMLKISDGARTDAVFVNFGENGSQDFENGYDGKKMFGGEEAPQLYLVENDMQLSIDYLKTMDFNETRTVQMNLQPKINGEYTITANLDSLPGTQLMLEDLVTGTMHNFNEDTFYTFNASKGDDPARFVLHFNFNATGIENPEETAENSVKVYSWDKVVYISNSDNDFAEATIHIYDLLGRELVNTKANLGNLTRIPVQVNNSYLVVQVIKGSNVVTQKVFVK